MAKLQCVTDNFPVPILGGHLRTDCRFDHHPEVNGWLLWFFFWKRRCIRYLRPFTDIRGRASRKGSVREGLFYEQATSYALQRVTVWLPTIRQRKTPLRFLPRPKETNDLMSKPVVPGTKGNMLFALPRVPWLHWDESRKLLIRNIALTLLHVYNVTLNIKDFFSSNCCARRRHDEM